MTACSTDCLWLFISISFSSFGWTYDANGNRLTQTGTAAISYSYAAKSNVLTSYTAGGIATTVTSNGIGSITAQTPASGSATALTYNAAERLASVAIGGTSAGTYTYDAFGQRSLKTASGVTSSFLFDQTGKLLEEIDTGTSTAKQDTVYLGAQPLADINPATGAIYWLHTDHLGTVQAATTSAKAVAWSGAYKPFGTVTAGKGLLTQNLRFAGQYADTATAFYQNGFRDYAPGLGRYVESDPYGLVGGLNTYVYVQNNPIGAVDPLGLAPAGHHIVPRSVWRDENVSDAARSVFDNATNKISDPRYTRHNAKNYDCTQENQYRDAVKNALRKFLDRLGKKGGDLTADEAQSFADEIKNADPNSVIGRYNSGVQAEMDAQLAEVTGSDTVAAEEAAAIAEEVASITEAAEAAGALVEAAAPVIAAVVITAP